MLKLLARGASFFAAFLLLITSARGDVIVLGQPGSHATLQAAIDAAQDGDVLLIEPGTYTGFTIDDKALTLLPTSPGNINVNGLCKVRNLSARRAVSISGLFLKAPTSTSSTIFHPGLTLEDNSGHVRLQQCTLQGGKTSFSSFSSLPAGPGLRVLNSPQVFVTECRLIGADYGYASGYNPRSGGDGLRSTNSGVALYGGSLFGGDGSEESYPKGGKGGAGCFVEEWGLFAAGTTLNGGQGGGGDYIGCTEAGDGGDALVVSNAQARMLDSALTPGAPGGFFTCTPGVPGQPIVNTGGVVQLIPGAARALVGPTRTTDNATTSFVVGGQPGDKVWLLRSPQPAYHYYPSMHGVAGVRYPWLLTLLPAGTIGPLGTLDLQLTLGNLGGLEPGWIWYLQALCEDAGGLRFLSNPLTLLVENT